MKVRLIFTILLLPFFSLSQECIDESLIDPAIGCFDLYDPVCGCNGEVYSNSCYATYYNGVTEYIDFDEEDSSAVCVPFNVSNYCDSITVEFVGFDYLWEEEELVMIIDISTNLPEDVNYAYAGFVLIDEFGETLAYESDEAANVYGFGGVYTDTRYLVFEELIEFPFEGSIQLISGFFAGTNELIECTFPISISFDGNVNLEGQYLLELESDFVEIDENQFLIYDFEDDFACYELMEFTYTANDSVIFLTSLDPEMQFFLPYQNYENLNLLVDGEYLEFENVNFNPDTLVECGECAIYDVFAEAGECDSAGYFMVELEFLVENSQAAGFSVLGNGTTYGEFDYSQNNYTIGPLLGNGTTEYEFLVVDNDNEDCSDFYELGTVDCSQTTDVVPFNFSNKKLLYTKNILGESILNPKANTPYIYFYNDGSYEKKVIFVPR